MPLEEGAVIPILQMSKVRHGLGNVSKVTLQSQDSLNDDTLPLEGIEKEKNLHVCVHLITRQNAEDKLIQFPEGRPVFLLVEGRMKEQTTNFPKSRLLKSHQDNRRGTCGDR